ncbi:MAG: hypothetical protein IT500_16270 [Rubrivivax sp.]|nr:hypothetical protein [Rubrivivax sp.]
MPFASPRGAAAVLADLKAALGWMAWRAGMPFLWGKRQDLTPKVRALAVLNGKSVDDVVNAGVDPLYRLRRLGAGVGHALARAESPPMPARVDIGRFAKKAMSVADKRVEIQLGKVGALERIRSATGFDLAGYERVLDNYGVRHTMKQHGSQAQELRRGQIAVTLDDFGLIPLITAEPDLILHDGKNKVGRDVIVFAKTIDGIGYRHVEEIRSGKRLVVTDSMRKKKGAWGS